MTIERGQQQAAQRQVHGQVIIEYFVMLAVVALMTVIGLKMTTLHRDVRSSLETFFHRAADKIAK